MGLPVVRAAVRGRQALPFCHAGDVFAVRITAANHAGNRPAPSRFEMNVLSLVFVLVECSVQKMNYDNNEYQKGHENHGGV